MFYHHATMAEALGASGTDVILRKGFEHGVLGELGKGGEGTNAEGEGRQDKVLQVNVFTAAVVVDGVEVAEHIEVCPIGQDIGEKPRYEDGGKE